MPNECWMIVYIERLDCFGGAIDAVSTSRIERCVYDDEILAFIV